MPAVDDSRPSSLVRHAGRPRRRRTRRADRRRLAADLPDLDLRPGRRRAAAPAATSTPARRTRRANGSSGRSPRSRAGRTGSRSPPGRRRPRPSPSWPAPGDEIVVGDDVYGGTYRYLERVRRGAGVDARYVDLAGGPDALWEALTERTRLVWFETPSNPHLKVVDIAATVADRRPARGRGRPAAAGRGRQHVRVAGAPAAPDASARTSSSTRRRSTSPATRTRSWAWRSPRTRPSPSACASSRTRWARCPGRSTASSSCAACGRSTCGWNAMARTPSPSPRSSAGGRTWRRSATRGSAGWSRSCRRAGGRRGRTAGRTGRSRSPRGPGCSPWPNRSAASNP